MRWIGLGPTIRDVARVAGVSKSTVSRVLNADPNVAEETRCAVFAAIKEIGYTRNALARGLNTRRTGTIGLIMSDITNPFHAEVARGVEDLASDFDSNVILCNTDGRPKKEAAYIDLLVEKRVDGIIFTSVKAGESDMSNLRSKRIPFVFAGRTLPDVEADSVVVDNVLGGFQAATHLVRLGHQRVAYLAGPSHVSASADRYEGYCQALRRAGVELDPQLVVEGDFKQEGGYRAMSTLLDRAPGVTAVFAANDYMAMGALEAIYERGFRVPEDIAVVGFDDIPFARLHLVQLTTVAQPKYDIGAIAARMLFERIEGKVGDEQQPRRVVLPPRLVVRRTCGEYHRREGAGETGGQSRSGELSPGEAQTATT
ncbi:MAG: LacI family transcriptional regulator [Firmicutes bacterium]|jgi:LacI family transcriptional regulator|nr:LacI family transcriptional regulator [Bacillota bacterium]MDH7494732.1 LacI family DNA-binding transcriptional regulator [Bacillota bacterium]